MKNLFGEFTKAAVLLQEAGVLGMKWGVSRPGETKSQTAMRVGKKAIIGGLHAKTELGKERLKAVKDKMVKRINSIQQKKANLHWKDQAYKSLGLVKVRGAVSGKTYWESLQEGGPGSGRHKGDTGASLKSAEGKYFVSRGQLKREVKKLDLLHSLRNRISIAKAGYKKNFSNVGNLTGHKVDAIKYAKRLAKVHKIRIEQQMAEGGPGSGRHKGDTGISGGKLLSLVRQKDAFGQYRSRVKSFNPKTAKGEKRANKALGWLEKNAARIVANKSLIGKKFRMSKAAKRKNYGPVYGEQEVQEGGVGSGRRSEGGTRKIDYLSKLQKSLAGYHKRMADSYMQKHANMGKAGKRNPVFLKKAQYHQRQIGT